MSKSEILAELPNLRRDERAEILERLCDLQKADFSREDQTLVDEALRSGPARPADPADWDNALQRGLRRAGKLK